MEQWEESECLYSDFGDKRLNKRLAIILHSFSNSPKDSIPTSCQTWDKTIGVYRFMDNDKVTYDSILQGHIKATIDRISCTDVSKEEVLLAVQDTTIIDFTEHRSHDQLGHTSNSFRRGILVHPTLLITPDRLNLGILDAKIWTRDLSSLGSKAARKSKPIEEKESYRWLESYISANNLAKQLLDKTIVSVGDRESDIYDLFELACAEDAKAKLLVRAAHDRRVLSENNEINLMWNKLEASEELGRMPLIISQTQHHQARETELVLKSQKIKLKAPPRKDKKLEDLEITAVLAQEVNPPSETDSVEWMLLTTLEVNMLSDAINVLHYYTCRWQIEMYFRTLKGGCEIEKLQFEEPDNLMNAIATYMIVSWRIQYLLMLGRECPDLPADILFSNDEIIALHIAKSKPKPEKMPTVFEMVILIATMGGFLNRKGDKYPGLKTFWVGLNKLLHYTFMYQQMSNSKDVYNG